MSIKTWKLALALGLCAIGVSVFVLLQLPGGQAGEPPTDASYVDNEECSDCHDDINLTWSSTPHASAFPVPFSGGNPDCKPCHTTGAGHPEIYPATGYDNTTDLPTYLQNVTCQACHGPGSDHIATGSDKKATIGLVMNASLCGSCHYSEEGLGGEHHPTYNEWLVSGHADTELPSFISNVTSCSNCHDAWNSALYLETGVYKTSIRLPNEDAPITWEISCTTCHDPHDADTPYQLRVPVQELCAKCHNAGGAKPGQEPHHPMAEMRNNTAGYGIDRTQTYYMSSVYCAECHMGVTQAELPNHTFAPNPKSCGSTNCHPDTFGDPDVAEKYIRTIQSVTMVQMSGAAESVEEAEALLEMMAGNRTNQLNLANSQDDYSVALFNLESVETDSSYGNHNPGLASALLGDATQRAERVMSNLTPPAKITGVQVQRGEDGSVSISWSESSAADFAKYRIYVLTTSKTNLTEDTWKQEITGRTTLTASFDDLDEGTTYYVYVTAVDVQGNEIVNTIVGEELGAVEEEEEGLTTLDMGLIAGIVLLAIIAGVLAVMLMRKPKTPKPETPQEKKEE